MLTRSTTHLEQHGFLDDMKSPQLVSITACHAAHSLNKFFFFFFFLICLFLASLVFVAACDLSQVAAAGATLQFLVVVVLFLQSTCTRHAGFGSCGARA